jgi:hypothetical protein
VTLSVWLYVLGVLALVAATCVRCTEPAPYVSVPFCFNGWEPPRSAPCRTVDRMRDA